MKVSLFSLIGVILYKLKLIKTFIKEKRSKHGFMFFTLFFYFVYLLVMMLPSKKLDRYMLVIMPGLSLMAVYGYYYLFEKISFAKGCVE